MPMQVCLVVEADGDGDVGGRLTVEQATTGGFDPAAGEVAVRREPVGAGEAADQVGRVRVQQGGCVAQGEARHGVGVEQVSQVRGEPVGCGLGGRCAQVPADPVADQGEPALGFQGGPADLEGPVQLVDAGAKQRVVEGRGVDGGADQRLVEHFRVDVEHPLAEAVFGGRPPGVGHVGWEQCDRRSQRSVFVVVQVVADGAFVDDEQRPGVVGMLGIRVIGEPCVEDLDDPGHRRRPRPYRRHAHNVQERDGPTPALSYRALRDQDRCTAA
ncbi:hypothetical protein GCM10009608_45870 [Pseudonocardia alaniniphila]